MGKFDLDDLLHDTDEEGPPAEHRLRKAGSAVAFVRKDPNETPRPPDLSGSGLGEEIDPTLASRKADPLRRRPDDALADLYNPEAFEGEAIVDLGQELVKRRVITGEQLSTAQRVMKQTPGKLLTQVLIELGVDEIALQQVMAAFHNLPFERVDFNNPDAYDQKAFRKLGVEYCQQHLVLPLRREGSRTVIGTTNAEDVFVLDDVGRRLGVTSLKHVLIAAYDIRGVIETLTESETEEYNVDEILANVDEDDVEVVHEEVESDKAEDAESSPVVRYVNHIIQTAVKEGASDIHVEPDEKALKVRFRIDGILFEAMTPPKKMHAAITSRLKIMANLDIAERRLPQDGRIRATVLGRKLDLRVSTVPTPRGEKTVMRILDTRSINVSLDDLGITDDTLFLWKKQIDMPHGILLVTGPTGSGKTTTLYSSLRQMDIRKLNISTVEDPVEYHLSGITQIQTHEKIGMTFANALRALMRQDPDVIMVGEIRDLETATTAIQAALTGHLVLSTLHTNDAPASITRLINIGIEPFLVGAAINGVLAQRLVRRICDACKQPIEMTEQMQEFAEMHDIAGTTLMHGAGCSRCRETGYSGRTGLYELLVMNDQVRDVVARNPNVSEFRRMCVERGMVTLREDGFKKVKIGATTVEEVLSVTEATI
jgi:type IV pilus assembly protein PilB